MVQNIVQGSTITDRLMNPVRNDVLIPENGSVENRNGEMVNISSIGHFEPPILTRFIFLLFISLNMLGHFYVVDFFGAVANSLQEENPDFFTNKYLGFLGTLYSYPSMFLPIFGGILLNNSCPRRWLLMFVLVSALGQIMCSIGLLMPSPSSPMIIGGRLGFALFAECSVAGVNVFIIKWFRHRYLSFAFGFQVFVSRLGSILVMVLQPWLYGDSLIVGVVASSVVASLRVVLVLISNHMDRYLGPDVFTERGSSSQMLPDSLISDGHQSANVSHVESNNDDGDNDIQGRLPILHLFVLRLKELKVVVMKLRSILIVSLLTIPFAVFIPFKQVLSPSTLGQAYSHEFGPCGGSMVGYINGLVTIVVAILSPFIGIWTDKMERRLYIFVVSHVILLLSFLLVVCRLTGNISISFWLVYALIGFGQSFISTLIFGTISEIVPKDISGMAIGAQICTQNFLMVFVFFILTELDEKGNQDFPYESNLDDFYPSSQPSVLHDVVPQSSSPHHELSSKNLRDPRSFIYAYVFILVCLFVSLIINIFAVFHDKRYFNGIFCSPPPLIR